MDKFLIRKETFHELAKSFGLNADTIEKGRALPDGTVRNWKGVDYIKKNGKWLPKGKGRSPAKEEVKGDKSAQITDKVDGMKIEDLEVQIARAKSQRTFDGDMKAAELKKKLEKLKQEQKEKGIEKQKDPEEISNNAEDEQDKIFGSSALWEQKVKSAIKTGDKNKITETMNQIKSEYDVMSKKATTEDQKGFIDAEYKKMQRIAGISTVVNASSNFNVGQEVEFKYGGNTLSGKITAKGQDGVTIHDKDDNIYHVNYNTIGKTTKNADGTIPADSFNADDYKKSFTDPKATKDAEGIRYIYESLGEVGKEAEAHTIEKMEALNKRMQKTGGTDFEYTVDKEHKIYTRERQALHEEIMNRYLSEEKIKAAKPPKGEKPKFIMFGGRGGSGKSWFTDPERKAGNGWDIKFDESKFIKIDADEIKSFLKPPYEGWNAGEVHEESSHIKKMIQAKAKELGLNIIIDGTMAWSPKGDSNKVRNEMMEFKQAGYSLEAHYMFVPVQESTKRAIFRFAHKNKDENSVDYGKYDYKGRLVPMDILLGMQDNEKSFDSVKDICDNWSFSDNQGKEPKLISQKGK